MTNKKKLDEIVHEAVENSLEELGDQLADRVAQRLMTDSRLVEIYRTSELATSPSGKSKSEHKMFNPEAGP